MSSVSRKTFLLHDSSATSPDAKGKSKGKFVVYFILPNDFSVEALDACLDYVRPDILLEPSLISNFSEGKISSVLFECPMS